MTPYEKNHLRGALQGGAVGDALGTTLEFSHPTAPAYPEKMKGPHTDVIGQGPFSVAKGQITDDTQMAVQLCTSLRAKGGFDWKDVARGYVTWRGSAFDIGGQTSSSIRRLREDLSRVPQPAEGENDPGYPFNGGGGFTSWEQGGYTNAPNGSLMRTWPIGVFFHDDVDALIATSITDSALTHFDPRCMLACASMNMVIAACAKEGATKESVIQAATAGVHLGAEWLLRSGVAGKKSMITPDELTEAVLALLRDLNFARMSDPQLYGPEVRITGGGVGFVRVAYRLAFYALMHAESYSEAMIDVVNRGGDADTNGAIAGCLLGAFFGEEGIPETWRAAVRDSTPRAPWDTFCHPRIFWDDLQS